MGMNEYLHGKSLTVPIVSQTLCIARYGSIEFVQDVDTSNVLVQSLILYRISMRTGCAILQDYFDILRDDRSSCGELGTFEKESM